MIRTKRHGCFVSEQLLGWGLAWRPCDDPQAERDGKPSPELTMPKIPGALLGRILGLFVAVGDSNEVSVTLARSAHDEGKTWRAFVPRQRVSGAAVRDADNDDVVDLETGEPTVLGPGFGWIPAGTIHSHNTMGAFFSSTDDADDMGKARPTAFHAVVGELTHTNSGWTYQMVCSLVHEQRRIALASDVALETMSVTCEPPPASALAQVTRESERSYSLGFSLNEVDYDRDGAGWWRRGKDDVKRDHPMTREEDDTLGDDEVQAILDYIRDIAPTLTQAARLELQQGVSDAIADAFINDDDDTPNATDIVADELTVDTETLDRWRNAMRLDAENGGAK